MRAMTYNIQHGLDHKLHMEEDRWVCNLKLTTDVVKKYKPDFCAFNEVFGGGDTDQFFDQPKAIEELIGYKCIFAQAIDLGYNRIYGNALASKHPIKSQEVFIIPEGNDPEDPKWKEARSILKAVIDYNGKDVCVIVTHIGLPYIEKVWAVEKLVEIIDNETLPIVLLGDFNMHPENEILKPLQERLFDTAELFGNNLFSFPSHSPNQKIDYIMTRDLEVTSADIPKILASDHCPIVADIDFNQKAIGSSDGFFLLLLH